MITICRGFDTCPARQAIAGVHPNSDFLAALQAQAAGKTSSFFSGVLDDSSVIAKLAKPFGDPFKIGFSQSMDTVFLVGAFVVSIAVVVLAFLPHIELRGSSPLAQQQQQQAREDQAAADAKAEADAQADVAAQAEA